MKINKIIFYATLLALLFGIQRYGFSNGEAQVPIKEKAELEEILKSIELKLNDFTVYELGNDISINGVKGGVTQFKTPYNKNISIADFRKSIILDENGFVVGLGVQGDFQVIASVSKLKKLRWLSLKGKLTKIFDISHLQYLEELNLPGNGLKEIENLTNIALRYANLDKNQLTAVDMFSGLTSLEYLSLFDNQVKTIEGLKNGANLVYFDLSHNPIAKLIVDDSFKRLEILKAVGNSISHLTFGSLIKIKKANFNGQPIKTVVGLKNLKKLEEINFNGAKLSGLDVSHLKNLKTLFISHSSIVSLDNIKGLKALNKLEKFGVAFSKITKITNLSGLKRLKSLSLAGCQLQTIEGLDDLEELQEINFSKNKLTKIQGLDHLKKLKLLDLSNNPIEVFEGVGSRMLDKVILSDTKIASIKGFSGFPVLGAVILKNTNIRSLEGYEGYLTPRDSSLVFFLSGNGLSYKEQGAILRQLLKYNVDYIL